jgi:FkbM family methyltransferase
MRATPLIRTFVSYVPSRSVLGLRRLADLSGSVLGRPHEADYLAFRGLTLTQPRVVDVGANRGQAIASFRMVLNEPRIWSFEPNPDLAAHVRKRFGSNDLEVFSCGLGSSSRRMSLYLPRYGHTVWDTRASLVESEAARLLDPAQFWRYSKGRAAVEKMEVEIQTLDAFGLSPNIVKVDVEGTEAEVIEGGMATIRTHMPMILAEGSVETSMRQLGPLGYRRHRFEADKQRLVVDDVGDLNTFLLVPDHYPFFGDVEIAGA